MAVARDPRRPAGTPSRHGAYPPSATGPARRASNLTASSCAVVNEVRSDEGEHFVFACEFGWRRTRGGGINMRANPADSLASSAGAKLEARFSMRANPADSLASSAGAELEAEAAR